MLASRQASPSAQAKGSVRSPLHLLTS